MRLRRDTDLNKAHIRLLPATEAFPGRMPPCAPLRWRSVE